MRRSSTLPFTTSASRSTCPRTRRRKRRSPSTTSAEQVEARLLLLRAAAGVGAVLGVLAVLAATGAIVLTEERISNAWGILLFLTVITLFGWLFSRSCPNWLILTYLLHTMGELTLSPVGLSAMTRLAPARALSLMMGVWFLASSVGNFMGGFLVRYYEAMDLPVLFGTMAACAISVGVVLALFVRPIRRMLADERH